MIVRISVFVATLAVAVAEPVTFEFTGQVDSRFVGSAEVVFPPEIPPFASVSGSITYDLGGIGTENQSALSFLGKYDLLAEAVSVELRLNELVWRFASVPDDTFGTGPEEINSFYVQHLHAFNPDEIAFRVWDRAPAQDSYPFLEAGQSGQARWVAVDDDAATAELVDLAVPAVVPSTWRWSGTISTITADSRLLFGFGFTMEPVVAPPERPVITRWALQPGGDLELVFVAEPGFGYELESSTDLGVWSRVGPLSGGDGEVTITVATVGSEARFYRVRKAAG